MYSDFEGSQNSSYENLNLRRKTQVKGKENSSVNRNSTIYSSITQVIEKSQSYQHLQLPYGNYYGQIKHQKANGVGSCIFKNGGFYYGEWRNNVINGIGVFFFGIGGYLRGEFVNGKADGILELQYQNGQSYIGQFSEGRQHGHGIKSGRRGKENVYYKNGIRVYGDEQVPQYDMNMILKNQLPHIYIHLDRIVYGLSCDLTGLGVIQYFSGRVDMGWFQNGSLNGDGRIIFKSGDIYNGKLQNGQFNGQGFYLNYQTKQITEGHFQRNQITTIDSQKHKYPPEGEQNIDVVEERIVIKNIYIKTRLQMSQNNRPGSVVKGNKIQNLISHMLNPKRNPIYSRSEVNGSTASEELLDNLLQKVQSPQQRRNLESIISQVTSPSRIR